MYDNIDPAVGIPLTVFLWTLLLVITLVSLRRAKVLRDKKRRIRSRASRRESFIYLANHAEENYIDGLKNQGHS